MNLDRTDSCHLKDATATTVYYYDGQVNKAHLASIMPYADGLVVYYGQMKQYYPQEMIVVVGAVGQLHPVIELPDDARIEFLDQQIPTWLNTFESRLSSRVLRIENGWRWLLASMMVMVVILGATYRWGIPALASFVAQHLPASTLNQVGQQAEQLIIDQTEPTQLSIDQQNHYKQLYQQLINDSHLPSRLIFRQGGELIDANALAIPNGTIIVTDELIKLLRNDHEFVAVLAHEQGHLVERHSLQQVLRGLGFSVLYVAVTGDAVNVLGTLPAALINARYSQQFEQRADYYAVQQLKRHGIDPHVLSQFLTRLSEYSHEDNASSDFLDSHPATRKRIATIETYIAQ